MVTLSCNKSGQPEYSAFYSLNSNHEILTVLKLNCNLLVILNSVRSYRAKLSLSNEIVSGRVGIEAAIMTPRRRIFAFICSVVAAFAAEVSGECSDAGVCVPGPVNAAISAANRQVTVTATSTCGNPPAQYCRVQPLNRCFICNESTHSVDKMTDEKLSTSWQSVTWWEWYNNNNRTDEPLKVNVTLSFNKSYALTGQIRLIFKSPRPVKMVLEKSDDKGQTWTPLQYYAEDCNDRFNMSSTPVESITMGDFDRHCVEEYSDFNPQEDGEVLFDFLRRYSKSDFWNETLQEYFTATDIRLQMLHPSTEGQNNLDIITEEIFNQYYYSVAELRVIARCQCHGHGEYCDYPDMKGKDCDCIHNTEGEDCERCKPLFNNKPWMPATSENEPNPCEGRHLNIKLRYWKLFTCEPLNAVT